MLVCSNSVGNMTDGMHSTAPDDKAHRRVMHKVSNTDVDQEPEPDSDTQPGAADLIHHKKEMARIGTKNSRNEERFREGQDFWENVFALFMIDKCECLRRDGIGFF